MKQKEPQRREFNKALWVAVHERDEGRCQNPFCFYSGKATNQHHIKGWATHKKLRYDKDNLITLCSTRKYLLFIKKKGCHQKFHAWNGGYQAPCNKTLLKKFFTSYGVKRAIPILLVGFSAYVYFLGRMLS